MGGRVLLQDLIQGVAKRANISEQEAETFVRTVFTVISDTLADEKIIKIRNLGTFKLVEVNDRETVDTNTGAVTRIKGYRKVVFTPDNALKDLINKPFAQFEPVVLNEATALSDMERGVETLASDDEEAEDEEPDMTDAERLGEGAEADGEDSESVEAPEGETVIPEEAPAADEEAEVVQPEVSANDPEATEANDAAETVTDAAAVENQEQETDASEQTEETGYAAAEPVEEAVDGEPLADDAELYEEMAAANIEYQHADYQKVQDQKVEELNVTTQTVEHQTIEHQSIVHQGQDGNQRQGSCLRLSQGGMIALFVFILALMVGSYMAGYYRVLCPCTFIPEADNDSEYLQLPAKKDSLATVRQFKETVKHSVADTAAKADAGKAAGQTAAKDVKDEKTTPQQSEKNQADSLKQLREKAAQYPQVKNGTYLIVGVKAVHKLKSGESLLRLALNNYGSKDFAKYIIAMNHIKNPNLVQVGQDIKLPELVKK